MNEHDLMAQLAQLTPDELMEALRVRLSRDPGGTLPASFMTLGEGLIAEIVVALPQTVAAFPTVAWGGTATELLEAAWRRTTNRVPIQIHGLQVDDGESTVLRVSGEPPYATAWALGACASIRDPNAEADTTAFVAVPASDHFFYAPLSTEPEANHSLVRLMAGLARNSFDKSDAQRRISMSVYKVTLARPFQFALVAEG